MTSPDAALSDQPRRRVWLWLFGALIAAAAVASTAAPPWSTAVTLGGIGGALLLAARPDIAFACYFAALTLISEDILLVTEKLKPTLYYYSIPGLGINPFEAALIPLIIATILHRKGRIAGTRLDPTVWIFGLACLIGYITCIRLYGEPTRLFEPRRLLHFFIAYYLAVNLIRTRDSLKWFLFIYFAAIALKALQGVQLYTLGEGLQIKWRIRAIFTGWGDSLNFITFLLIVSTYLLDRVRQPWMKLWLLATPAVLFSFLFSFKRAYYVGLACGLGVLFLMQKGKARIRFIAAVLAGFVILLIIITVMGQWQAVGMRVGSILTPTKESSANYRLIEWANALISIRKNPELGIGLGGVMPMEIHLSRTNLLGVHNTYLWVAVKMGAIGLFAYLFLQFAFVQRLLKQNARLSDASLRSLSRGLTCVFVAFYAAQMFAPMFAQIRTATWFGAFMGIGMMLSQMDSQPDHARPDTVSVKSAASPKAADD